MASSKAEQKKVKTAWPTNSANYIAPRINMYLLRDAFHSSLSALLLLSNVCVRVHVVHTAQVQTGTSKVIKI